MSVLSHLALTVCYISVAVTIISLFLPQKRTRRIFGFVIGLFVTTSLNPLPPRIQNHPDTLMPPSSRTSVPEPP